MTTFVVTVWLYGSICFFTAIVLWSWTWGRYKQLPPGPQPWPIVGNFFDLREGGKSFERLVERYGPIFTVWMGSRPVIFVSGPAEMREALVDRADSFARRPKLYTGKHVTCGFRTVTSSSGPLWQTLRRNLVSQVLSPASLRACQSMRDVELRSLVERIRRQAGANDGVVTVLPPVRRSIASMAMMMCFGERPDEDTLSKFDKVGLDRIQRFAGGLHNYYLSARLWHWFRSEPASSLLKRSEEVVLPWIVKAREAARDGGAVPGRYLSTLLEMQGGSGLDGPLTDSHIMALCFEFVNGGTETISFTVENVLARIMSHPGVQRKLVEEIEGALGGRTFDEALPVVDRLPYLQAVIKETLRLYPTTSLAVPYCPTRPGATIGGYLVPESAVVFFRISSSSRDAKIWGDPESFRPERFVDDKTEVDLRGSKGITLLPFGLGRRICPGMGLAMLEMSRILAALVHTFEWSFADASGEPNLTMTVPPCEALGFSRLNTRLKVRSRERRRTKISDTGNDTL